MPAGADPPDLLVDTSVAVALVVADHAHHASTVEGLGSRRLGLAGHAAFELYSVLTRLPPPRRLTPSAVARLVSHMFPASRYLSADGTAELLHKLAERNVTGGAVYDALVGAAAAEHEVALATRDARALGTYRALGVQVELLTGPS